ncbi:hypothetical protein BS47DRAFT_1164160 [Hydnum rufescens UP504]|uniref:Alpha-type protein kinase domain-containing protein n=1 Tax=Hydnum rufescens UP504 TaxID=1448309 RepID=A0A9P6ATB8_9AGAM|nr:hypothetical protein BS47DRAFT_1164160 [Hydnum rufescens UP504]
MARPYKFTGTEQDTTFLAHTIAALIHLSFSSALVEYMDLDDYEDPENEHLVHFQHGLFTDIQGVYVPGQGFSVFDVIAHSAGSYPSPNNQYHWESSWDQGPRAYEHFAKNHVCNGICQGLQLPIVSYPVTGD